MPMKKSIKFSVKPGDKDIEKAREKGSEFLKSHGLSDDTVRAQMTILNELISNGKKFSDLRAPGNEMTILLLIDKNAVTVEVSNPVNESSYSQLNELDKTIQWIRGYQDPFEPYTIKLREASANSHSGQTNGFELARIAYEAGAILDFYVSENNILNLSAVRNLNCDLRS